MSRSREVQAETDKTNVRTLARRAKDGDRNAYLDLYLRYLPSLDRFIRHSIHYAEKIGTIERGLIDPCAIIDQVYIAGLRTLVDKPARMSFRNWFCYLGLHIFRQQIRIEHEEEPIGLALERLVPPDGNSDTEFWEFYQPDDLFAVEDVIGDHNGDPAHEVERQETAAEIEGRMKSLPPDLRELAELRFIDGLHADEIAALKGRTTEDVRQALRQACEILRQDLSA